MPSSVRYLLIDTLIKLCKLCAAAGFSDAAWVPSFVVSLLLQSLQFTIGNLAFAGYFVLDVVAACVHVVAGVLAVAGFFAAAVCLCCFLSLYCWQPCCCASTGAKMTSPRLLLPALVFLKL